MGDAEPQDITRLMGLSHKEFLRSLPAAVRGMTCHAEGAHIRIWDAQKTINIHLGPEQERRLGSLVLPQTRVTVRFEGCSAEQREAFLKRFELAFQRGGG